MILFPLWCSLWHTLAFMVFSMVWLSLWGPRQLPKTKHDRLVMVQWFARWKGNQSKADNFRLIIRIFHFKLLFIIFSLASARSERVLRRNSVSSTHRSKFINSKFESNGSILALGESFSLWNAVHSSCLFNLIFFQAIPRRLKIAWASLKN